MSRASRQIRARIVAALVLCTSVCISATPVTAQQTRSLGHDAFGILDRIEQSVDGMHAVGWAIDLDSTTPVKVQLEVDGAPVVSQSAGLDNPTTVDSANEPWRWYDTDNLGSSHGFDMTIKKNTLADGRHVACVVVFNTGVGADFRTPCQTFTVPTARFRVDVVAPMSNLSICMHGDSGPTGLFFVGGATDGERFWPVKQEDFFETEFVDGSEGCYVDEPPLHLVDAATLPAGGQITLLLLAWVPANSRVGPPSGNVVKGWAELPRDQLSAIAESILAQPGSLDDKKSAYTSVVSASLKADPALCPDDCDRFEGAYAASFTVGDLHDSPPDWPVGQASWAPAYGPLFEFRVIRTPQ